MGESEQARLTKRSSLAAWLVMPATLAVIAAAWAWAARGSQWWSVALRSPMFVRCGVVLMVATVALQIVLAAMTRLGRSRKASFADDQRGVAMIEFVLLFPIAFGIILVMVQTAQLMKGNMFVHYAAFSAARSAVVQIPRSLAGEDRNWLDGPESSAKLQRIRRAAVLAVLPVAGALRDHAVPPADVDIVAAGIESLYQAYGDSPPNWLSRKFADQYAYANAHTTVEVGPPADEESGVYGDREDIRVTVRHELHLVLPYVGRMLGEELSGEPGEYYSEVFASYVLVNQGRPDNLWYEYRLGDGVKKHMPPPSCPGEDPWLPR